MAKKNKSRNAAFRPNTPKITALWSINHYHSRLRWLHHQLWQDRLGVKRSLNVVCWRQVRFQALIWIKANGEIFGRMLARGLTYKDRDNSWDLNSHWSIVFFSGSLPKLQSTSYPKQNISDVMMFDASDGYANTQTAFRMELFCTSCNWMEQIHSEKITHHHLTKKFPTFHGIWTFISVL